MTKVLVFGVFDGLHEGHQFFLREAKKLGDYLVVVATPDEVVHKLKNKIPQDSLAFRIKHLENCDHVDEILIGDSQPNAWKIFERIRPDIIALGYDQIELRRSLKIFFESQPWRPKFEFIESLDP